MYLPKGLIITVGPAAAGKTTFCRRFDATEVVSSDRIRAQLGTDETDHEHESAVFARLHQTVQMRLRARCAVVVDATNLDPRSRKTLLGIARRFDAPTTAVRFDADADTLRSRNASRDRVVPADVLDRHIARYSTLSDARLYAEGFDLVVDHRDVRAHLWGDLPTVPVDVIGDVHGQLTALELLLERLGYIGRLGEVGFHHPDGRLPVLTGDLVDKGPDSLGALRTVMRATRKGQCLVVRGNHEHRLGKALAVAARTSTSIEEWRTALLLEASQVKPARRATFEHLAGDLDGLATGFAAEREFLAGLPLWLHAGGVVVAHASYDPSLALLDSPKHRRHQELWCMYGPGKAKGEARRAEWTASYTGTDTIVHGHFTVDEPTVTRNASGGAVIAIDTGAGDRARGTLSALRWGPEPQFVSVDTTVEPATCAAALSADAD